MNWRQKRVLVTGAGGFIGSHLAERLAGLGAAVRAMVHYNALGSVGWLGEPDVRGKMEIVAGDITDRDSVKAAMDGCEVVFHLAALIAIPYSYRSPTSYVRTNVEGTLNVLQAARETGVARVIHTSTSEVYGSARHVPIPESHPLQGQSPYSASKIGADKIAEAFHLSFDVPVVTVRPFNTFGPRQSARAVIPAIMVQCLAGKSEINLGSLEPTRDFNYVMNTVDGFVAAAVTEKAIGRTINIGSGREISIGDLARMIMTMAGSRAEIRCESGRVRPVGSEVDRLRADNTEAKTVLGWTPKVSLEDGLTRTLDWMRSHMGKYRPDAHQL